MVYFVYMNLVEEQADFPQLVDAELGSRRKRKMSYLARQVIEEIIYYYTRRVYHVI